MQFTIEVSCILKALDNVQGVVDKRNITPILSNVRLNVEDNNLIINATNMDLDIVEILKANVVSSGSTTAPASLLFETIKRLPSGDQVEFLLRDEKLHVSCGTFQATINCLPVEDFPIVQNNDFEQLIKIDRLILKRLFEKTRFAISLDETRYYLNGVYLHAITNDNQSSLRAVSTDGHRLALSEHQLDYNISLNEGVIIPKKTVDEILKVVDKLEDKEVEVTYSNSRICFKFSNLILTSKLIEGNFPNYDKVIPKTNDKVAEIQRSDFVNAIDLVSMYSDEKLKYVRIEFDNNKVFVKADKTVGGAQQELQTMTSIVEPMTISFNYRYLKDVCSLVKTETIMIEMLSDSSPVLVKQKGSTTETFVIMPMRL